MRRSSLIGHVCELLDLVRPLKRPADTVVKEFFRSRHYLGAKDRRFIADAFYAILRNDRFVRWCAEAALKSVPGEEVKIPAITLYVAYALKIQREPLEVVLDDVESSLKMSFPRHDCRQFLEEMMQAGMPEEMADDPTKRIALLHSFPDSIVAEWAERYGVDEAENLCAALNQPAPTTIRVNTLRSTLDECQVRLLSEGISSEPTKLSPVGLRLAKRVNCHALRSFKEGLFEMQDEGSQLLSLLLGVKPGQIVVDACAGGGGKTLHLAALMEDKGELYAFDSDEKRLANIRPRLLRAGVRIARLLRPHEEVMAPLRGKADAVLVDAPCSGVGTFRRNPELKMRFEPDLPQRLAKVQRQLLEGYSQLVKVGGRLVYSTCTLVKQENEDVVESFLGQHPEYSAIAADGALRQVKSIVGESSHYFMLLPHRTNSDGFFAAVLQRVR